MDRWSHDRLLGKSQHTTRSHFPCCCFFANVFLRGSMFKSSLHVFFWQERNPANLSRRHAALVLHPDWPGMRGPRLAGLDVFLPAPIPQHVPRRRGAWEAPHWAPFTARGCFVFRGPPFRKFSLDWWLVGFEPLVLVGGDHYPPSRQSKPPIWSACNGKQKETNIMKGSC